MNSARPCEATKSSRTQKAEKAEMFASRERNIRTTLKAIFFRRSSKIAGFSPLLRSREEKGAIFKLRKKRVFESCSNIPFPLARG